MPPDVSTSARWLPDIIAATALVGIIVSGLWRDATVGWGDVSVIVGGVVGLMLADYVVLGLPFVWR